MYSPVSRLLNTSKWRIVLTKPKVSQIVLWAWVKDRFKKRLHERRWRFCSYFIKASTILYILTALRVELDSLFWHNTRIQSSSVPAQWLPSIFILYPFLLRPAGAFEVRWTNSYSQARNYFLKLIRYLDNKNMLPTNFVELKRIQDVFSTKSTFLVVLLTVVVAAVESLSVLRPAIRKPVFSHEPGFSLFSMFPVDVFIWEAIPGHIRHSPAVQCPILRLESVSAQRLSRQVYDYFTAFE